MSGSAIEDVSVVGLGKLGFCLAAVLAEAGFTVRGADLNSTVVKQLRRGEAPFPEPHLEEYLAAAGDDLTGTTETNEAVASTDVTFIVVNTPSDENGRYDSSAVEAVCENVGEVLAEKDDYHLVVVTSTVFPGTTMGTVRSTLEQASGKRAGEEFGLAYSPEFIAIGDVIRGLEDPDFFLVGAHTERAGDIVEEMYERLGTEQTPVARLSPVEAEITKMAVNAYVTMKISYANTLGEICDGIGGDVDSITDALALDSRVGGEYLASGARFGGPCFPRDNVAFSRLAKDAGTQAPLAEATDTVNDQHTAWLSETVRDVTPDGGTVGVLGLTYKPGTYIVEESQGTELIASLQGTEDYTVLGYDPMAVNYGRTDSIPVPCHDTLDEVLRAADTAVLTIPAAELSETDAYRGHELTLVDPWRVLDGSVPPAVSYVPVGARQTESRQPRAKQS